MQHVSRQSEGNLPPKSEEPRESHSEAKSEEIEGWFYQKILANNSNVIEWFYGCYCSWICISNPPFCFCLWPFHSSSVACFWAFAESSQDVLHHSLLARLHQRIRFHHLLLHFLLLLPNSFTTFPSASPFPSILCKEKAPCSKWTPNP